MHNMYDDDTIDDCGPQCCLGTIVLVVIFFISSVLSVRVGDVVIGVLMISVFSIIVIWIVYACCCCCGSIQDSLPVITITVGPARGNPVPVDTRPTILNSYRMKKTGVVCTICMEDIKKYSHCKKIPECGHEFHKKCIDKWLMESKTCPNCRLDV